MSVRLATLLYVGFFAGKYIGALPVLQARARKFGLYAELIRICVYINEIPHLSYCPLPLKPLVDRVCKPFCKRLHRHRTTVCFQKLYGIFLTVQTVWSMRIQEQ